MHDLLERTKEFTVFFVGLRGTVERGWQDVVNAIVGARTKDCVSSVLVVALEEVFGGADLVFSDGRHFEGLDEFELGCSLISVVSVIENLEPRFKIILIGKSKQDSKKTRRSHHQPDKCTLVLHSHIPFVLLLTILQSHNPI